MKKIYLLLTVLLAISWIPQSALAGLTGADNYVFEKKTFEHKNLQINVITYESHQALEAAISKSINKNPKYGAIKVSLIKAFSVLNSPDANTCTIHIIDPAVSYEPEYIGHELMHCVYGEWHK